MTKCGRYLLVGGYEKFGAGAYVERTVSGLPPHYSARVRLLLLKLDSWNGENFYIIVDNTIIKTQTLGLLSDDVLIGNICGKESAEAETTFSEVFTHSASTLKVKLYSNLNGQASDESWGFSNFELVVYRCDPTCASCSGQASNQCTGCYSNAGLSNGVCSCNTG